VIRRHIAFGDEVIAWVKRLDIEISSNNEGLPFREALCMLEQESDMNTHNGTFFV